MKYPRVENFSRLKDCIAKSSCCKITHNRKTLLIIHVIIRCRKHSLWYFHVLFYRYIFFVYSNIAPIYVVYIHCHEGGYMQSKKYIATTGIPVIYNASSLYYATEKVIAGQVTRIPNYTWDKQIFPLLEYASWWRRWQVPVITV